MNTPPRGRGRGGPRGASRGDRGGGRGRGGRGGRGGGPRTDLSSVEFNYDQLASVSSTDFGFAPGPPQPAYVPTPPRSYPPTPNHNSPGPSGYSTPRRGLAFNPAAARGRGDFAGRGSFTPRGGRGGGLGFSSPQGAGVGGPRPFLVPVKFVKAQALPVGLGGDEEQEAGELETHVHAGVVLPEPIPEPEPAEPLGPVERDVDIMMSPLRPIAVPLFVSDVHPSPVAPTQAFTLPPGFVLGLTPRSPPSDSSDSDSDQIVFQPQHRRPSAPMTSPPSPSLAPTLLSSLPSPAASLPSIATAPPSPPLKALTRLPPPLLPPAPKLSKNAKKALAKASKKARKNGKEHARSGNQHLVGSSRQPDADRAEGDAMMDRILGVGVEDMDLGSDGEKPREGDSDLEWGDTLPPKRQAKDAGGPNRKEKRKLERRDRQEMEHVERLAVGARVEVEQALEPVRKTRADLAADDYASNVGTSAEPAQGVEDLSFLLSLITGTHKTIDELADSDRSEDGAGWQTTSGSESGEGSDDEVDSDDELEMDLALGEADAQVELAIAAAEDALMGSDGEESDDDLDSSDEEDRAIEAALLSGKKIRLASMGQAGPGGRRDKGDRKRAKKGKGRAQVFESDDDDSSSDDDDGPGRGGGTTWADDDEDYISGLQDIMDDNADLLDSRDRKSRKKLFKAIQDGDFRGVDFDDDDFASSSAKKSSSKKPKPDFFAAELQAQWEKDRTKKGAFKRARALARAEAADAPRSGGKHGSSSSSASDAASLNVAMRELILDAGRSTLSLPPMSKKSRVAVHLLAEVYSLKSKSLGSGKNRYPVLERTTRSAVYGVDERKVAAIIGTAAGEGSGKWGGRQNGKMGGLWAALGGEKSKGPAQRGGGGAKNREGVVVGVGAERIGSENIGFALLQKMGWKEGEQIGMSGGIHEPIAARVKTNKSGLGSGYSVSRFEAQAFAAGPSR